MKQLIVFAVCVNLFFGCFLIAENRNNGLVLELFYGQSIIDPVDLNKHLDYNNTEYNAYNDYYYKRYNNNLFYSTSVSNGIDTQFHKIKKSSIFGGRLKYYPNSDRERPRLAISVGFKYIDGYTDSSAELSYDIDNFYDGKYSITRRTNPDRLSVEGVVPQIGFHYSIINDGSVKVEPYISYGIIFASCSIMEQFYYQIRKPSGYMDEQAIFRDYKGKGTALAMDAGLIVKKKIFGSIGLFIDCGYSYQKIKRISGDVFYKRSYKDSNADGYIQEDRWSGDWWLENATFGQRPNVIHSWMDQNSTLSRFVLDLSGFYIRIGLSIKIF